MNGEYHYIGLDIHKSTISYCAKWADGRTVDAGKFSARREDIEQWAESRGKQPWIGGMEATLFTGYVYDVLRPYAADLQVGHPLGLKAISSGKHKGDRIDAEILSNLLRADLFPKCHMAPPRVRELRRVLRHRNFLVRQAVTMMNKTTGLLMEVGAPYDARRIHRKAYFNDLLETLEDVPNSVCHLLRMNRCSIESLQSSQKELLDALTQHKELRERVERLRTIRSVGVVTALTWALEIDDPARFSNIKKVQSYCGLCSGRNESAGKNKRAPISKQRNPHLQTVLIEAAKLAPRWNPELAEVRARVIDCGYNKNRATLAVARKLVAYLLAVDKSGNDFQPRGSAS